MKKEKLIVLDCDGVLLNYNQTFGKIYEQYFNEPLTVTNSNAYHAENYS
jgi:FMN phosphatase YigB (HAD superfamily)